MSTYSIIYVVIVSLVIIGGVIIAYKERHLEHLKTPKTPPPPIKSKRGVLFNGAGRLNYNIRLTLKAIIRTEQMLSKPFTEVNYTDPEELQRLLYCCVLTNNQVTFSFEEFRLISDNEKQLTAMLKEIEKANIVLSQFSRQKKEGAGDGIGSSQYIKDLVGTLIFAGLDANYAMNEMELSDIPVFVEAYEKKKREEMEASRLWTFMQIAPHIDTKKISSAKDLILFPWEEDEIKKKAEEVLIKDAELAERFFSGEFDSLKSN